MFRLQNKVPEVYVEESRDFQLFLRLYDTLFNGIKYDTDTIVNILDATKASDRVLRLLCTRVGFFPRVDIDSNVLKYIIAAFPYIMKYKGTKKAVEMLVHTIIKAEHNPYLIGDEEVIVTIDNNSSIGNRGYIVYIQLPTSLSKINRVALDEVMRYILPTGYFYTLRKYISVRPNASVMEHTDFATVVKSRSTSNSIRGSNDFVTTTESDRVIKNLSNAYDVMEVVGSSSGITEEQYNSVDYTNEDDYDGVNRFEVETTVTSYAGEGVEDE